MASTPTGGPTPRPFAPIAIVGRACLVPGALNPEALGEATLAGRDLVSTAPQDRWGVDRDDVLCAAPGSSDGAAYTGDRSWSDRGGYVTGFEQVWQPEGFALPAEALAGLDPVFLWPLHTAREALAGVQRPAGDRTGLWLGNLGFPAGGLARFAEWSWLSNLPGVGPQAAAAAGLQPVDARNRFMCAGPAQLTAAALGIAGGAVALDAACASSLYALKLACDALHDGRIDLALAGAVQRSEDLFIHVGFCALSAMSKSGRSRPFHADADGLVPAEGAGFLALKRLEDALRDGDTIHGVVRGVGLSNDGRGRGLLAPAVEGQVRAMRAAWEGAGLSPATAGMVECHATGTPVGDGTELQSMEQVFQGAQQLPIGSLKSNMGHLITAAGVAGIIKLLEAMRRGQRPPSLHADQPHPRLDSPTFRLLTAAEPWAADASGQRRGAVSAFGFGGNNAHVVIDQLPEAGFQPVAAAPPAPEPLAVVAVGAVVGPVEDAAGWAQALGQGRSLVGPEGCRTEQITLPLVGLRFPPKDLEQSLGQQLAVLRAAREAAEQYGRDLPRERTGVLVGIEADPEVARYGMRWRLARWAKAWAADASWTAAARDGVIAELESAGVLGTMPNIPANRLNGQLDVAGPSHVLSSGEASGLDALAIAARALRAGELDAFVIGASDLSCQPVHQAAVAAALPPDRQVPGDAAVVLILRRLADAQAAGEPVLAVITDVDGSASPADLELGLGPGATSLLPTHGCAHAAVGMVHLGAAVLSLATGARPDGGAGPARTARVSLPGARSVGLAASAQPPTLSPYRFEGPALTVPAHPPAPQLPALPHQPEPVMPAHDERPAGVETMAPAPALPPVLGGPTVDLSPPLRGSGRKAAATPAAPQAAAPQAAAPLAAAPQAPADPNDPAFALQQQHAWMQQVHQGFLAQQAAVHQQFLDLRQNALFALLSAQGAVPTAVPPAFAPTAAPPQAAPTPQPAAPTPPPQAAAPAPVATAPAPVATPAAARPTPTPRTPAAPVRPVPTPPAAARPPRPKPAAVASRGGIPDGPRPASERREPVGPTLDRDGLIVHASGNISEIFGDLFKPQDAWERVCRMPEPPLLLADRMTGVDAEPGSMGKGTIWTETDVTTESWYLNEGRMPAGIMIESGQADLMLISYLGVDLLNKGERVYRLLGCTLTYHRDLPRPGETLQYDIHVDGHANHGPVRLFFFHYDCEIDGQPALTVRQGQAGFFTDAELADSAGIIWTPEEQEIVPEPRLDAPALPLEARSFTREQITAFAEGRAWECFGDAFFKTKTHNRPPAVQKGEMLFLHEVTDLDPRGGPWGRGYLRATQALADDDWFYDGHFKNDPCMPGTLMFEGCAQAMSFYLAAMGVTVDRDGWRFQPVTGEPFDLRCRGQAIPGNRELIYEVFVEEFVAGPVPTLYADLLCTIDGLKAFHARRVGIQLVPDWPITSMPELWGERGHPGDHGDGVGPMPPGAPADHAQRPLATLGNHVFDYQSLLACAWGKPSDAFGPMYARFDGHRRVARLPGPPYHFMSRVTRIERPEPVTEVNGKLVPGAKIELEFDVDPAAWYFDQNGAPTMPFCVFLEAALQPCGWLASYVGSALTVDRDLSFRNLDGTATWTGELLRDAGTLTTRVEITKISKTAGMIIEGFDVTCVLTDPDGSERVVYTMNTVFGFFPGEALQNQVGLPTTPEQRAFLEADSDHLTDLTTRPERYFGGTARLAGPMLCMVDRITGFWPEGGAAGLGRVRGEKDVDSAEWFFKAHFFQDPVQPGSLGLEALLQLLQWFMLHKGMAVGIDDARFEPLMQHRPLTWKYRGQVVPENKCIQSTMEITEVGEDDVGPYVIGTGSLWVDGKRIYEVENMGMRIVADPPPTEEQARDRRSYAPTRRLPPQLAAASTAPVPEGTTATIEVDPERDTWVGDHRPTWTVPALPMMVIADMLARPVAEAGRTVTSLGEVKVKRWVTVTGPRRFEATVVASRQAGATVQLSDEDGVIASGQVGFGVWPEPPPRLGSVSGPAQGDLYEQGRLFHGPAFQLLETLTLSDSGASATLVAPAGAHPTSVVHPALLDGATHPIPHDQLQRWFEDIGPDKVAYPAVLQTARFFGPPPARDARVRCEVRPAGNLGTPELPVFDMQLSTVDGVWAELRLVEACFPKGPLGMAAPAERMAFLRDRRFVLGLRLSRIADDGSTRLTEGEVAASDWLPGTVQGIYGTRDVAEIARREHLANKIGVHPSAVDLALPVNTITVDQRERDGEQIVYDGGVEGLDLAPVRAFWTDWFAMEDRWPAEDLYYGLMRRFVRRVVLSEPEPLLAIKGRPVLYLANHQVGIESLVFSILAGGLHEVPCVTVAKAEHRQTWLGDLIRLCFAYPGVVDPKVITYFEREDRASLVTIIQELATGLQTPVTSKGGHVAAGQSVMVHVEGTRSLDCRTPVQKMSGAFIDMAVQTATPIVPVRFTGGLPTEPLESRIEYPVGLGTQDIWLGAPLLPETLRPLPYGERKKRVIDAINNLGPANADEAPHEDDPYLEEAAQQWMSQTGATHEHAVLYRVLAAQASLSDDTQALLATIAAGNRVEGDDPVSEWLERLRGMLAPTAG